MATLLDDLIPMLTRELNAPGIEFFSTMTAASKLGYIQDAFWDARLTGMLPSYTIVDGADVVPAATAGKLYFVDMATNSKDLDQKYWMLLVLFAGFRLLRLKIMNLATSFKASAGPVDYEQQASATVLRALLASMTGRINELKDLYSDEFSSAVFYLMDGVAQAEYSLDNALADQQVFL